MAPRRDLAVDPHDRSVAPDPDQVEREAHRERVHRAAPQPQRAVRRQAVEPAEPAAPRVEPARLVHSKPAIQLVCRQPPQPPPPPAHCRLSPCTPPSPLNPPPRPPPPP